MVIDDRTEELIKNLEKVNYSFEKFYPFLIKVIQEKFNSKKDFLNRNIIHVI